MTWRAFVILAIGACSGGPTTPRDASSSGDDAADAAVPTGSGRCTVQPPAPASSCMQVTQAGITWTFDAVYPCGQFVNGDWWVTPTVAGGKVRITAMTPAASAGTNGWMVNPSSSGAQSFDDGGPDYSASLQPPLPYDADGDSSIIKAISLAAGCTKTCLQSAAVLTVLDTAPPATAFRPAYFGTAKPLYCADTIHTQLPALATTAQVDAMAPTLAGATNTIVGVQLNFMAGWSGEQIRPKNNVLLDDPYGPEISNNNAQALLRILLIRPGDTTADRESAVNALVQYGIDNDAIFASGKAGWAADGGHGLGMRLPIAFAAMMLDDAEMATRLRGAKRSDFAETAQTRLNAKGTVIWGQDRCADAAEYWADLTNPQTRTCVDPYLLIDGGAEPGGWYQGCCTSQAMKGSALAVRLVAGLAPIWNDDISLAYADRWVATGAYTQPDFCAPPAQGGGPDPQMPGTCIPDPDLEQCSTFPDCACQAGKQCGRFPALHGTQADSGAHRSDFVDVMWSAFR